MEYKSLNPFLCEKMLEILQQKDTVVSYDGFRGFWTLSAKKGDKTIFYIEHERDTEYVCVNEEYVAYEAFGERTGCVLKLYNAMMAKKKQIEEEKKIAHARKDMMDYDIRAMEFLKQFQRS